MKTPTIIVAALSLCCGCRTLQYVPVETVRTEYRDNYIRDSIIRYDSIHVKERGDTVYLERYRYLYKDKIVRDSIFTTDTIRIPYPVEVPKEVKKPLSGWQHFQLWSGRILLVALILVVIYFLWRLKR